MTKHCLDCSVVLTNDNWLLSRQKIKSYVCNDCKKKRDQRLQNRNTNRMWVNGNHVSTKHPLHKPGRYIIEGFFGDAVAETEKTKEGYIYIITNPAWPGWVKVGKALDADKRVAAYQMYSPFKDYVCERTFHVPDVHAVEHAFHRGRKKDNGEWYQMTVDKAASIVEKFIPQVGDKKHVKGHHELVPQPLAASL